MSSRIFNTPGQMKIFAAKFAAKLIDTTTGPRAGKIVSLYGDLGSGKTTFAQGFGRGLGIKKHIQSPTFVLMRRYKLPKQKTEHLKYLYHLDLYRIKDVNDIKYLSINEIFKDPSVIILIEWADRIEDILPARTIKIKLKHIKSKNARKIIF